MNPSEVAKLRHVFCRVSLEACAVGTDWHATKKEIDVAKKAVRICLENFTEAELVEEVSDMGFPIDSPQYIDFGDEVDFAFDASLQFSRDV